jgi:hypothetical protein
MAQIENTANGRKGKSFSHNKKLIIRIDMTPMVDLGFLLITFLFLQPQCQHQKLPTYLCPAISQ